MWAQQDLDEVAQRAFLAYLPLAKDGRIGLTYGDGKVRAATPRQIKDFLLRAGWKPESDDLQIIPGEPNGRPLPDAFYASHDELRAFLGRDVHVPPRGASWGFRANTAIVTKARIPGEGTAWEQPEDLQWVSSRGAGRGDAATGELRIGSDGTAASELVVVPGRHVHAGGTVVTFATELDPGQAVAYQNVTAPDGPDGPDGQPRLTVVLDDQRGRLSILAERRQLERRPKTGPRVITPDQLAGLLRKQELGWRPGTKLRVVLRAELTPPAAESKTTKTPVDTVRERNARRRQEWADALADLLDTGVDVEFATSDPAGVNGVAGDVHTATRRRMWWAPQPRHLRVRARWWSVAGMFMSLVGRLCSAR